LDCRKLLIVLALLLSPALSLAQTSTITATVVDPNGNAYANGTVSAFLQVATGQSPSIGGVPIRSLSSGPFNLNSSGFFSIVLNNNTSIVPAGTTYNITVCGSQVNIGPVTPNNPQPKVCFTVINIVVSVNTDISTTLNSQAAVLGPAGPTTNWINLGGFPAACGVNVPYMNALGTINNTCLPPEAVSYTVATLPGSPVTNQIAAVTDGNGVSCTVGGGAIRVLCQWTGAVWAVLGGSAGGSPGGVTLDAQCNLASAFSNCSGLVVSQKADQKFYGPTPYIDIRAYGARIVASNSAPIATATAVSGNTTVNLNVASSFQNGDGVVIYGAGAACTLVTPGAPTVVPSVATGPTDTWRFISPNTNDNVIAGPAGATSYAYKIVARDRNGCLTAAGAQGTTATGAASLGGQSVGISTLSRTNAVVTVNTSATHGLVVGAWVNIANTTDSLDFGGFYQVATVPDNTHFTYVSGTDSRLSISASATGGTVYWYNCNHLTWTGQANDWVYYIYGRTAGSLVLKAVSKPGTLSLVWDDYGATMTDFNAVFPSWVPTAPPVSATSDHLVTTIVSGAGTTSIVVANAPSTSVTASMVFDDGTAILAAAAAAASNGGSLLLPDTPGVFDEWLVNSVVTLPFNTPVNITQAGTLALNETLILPRFVTWRSYPNKKSFGPGAFQPVMTVPINIGNNTPGLYSNNSLLLDFRGIGINAPDNGKIGLLADQGQFLTIEDGAFYSGNGGNFDYTGVGLYAVGISPVWVRNTVFLGSTNANFGLTTAPVFACTGCGISRSERIMLGVRGFYMDSNTYSLRFLWQQGGITPMLTMSSFGTGSAVEISDILIDTAPVPIISIFGGPPTNVDLTNIFVGPSADAGGFVPPVTGVASSGIVFNGNVLGLNQTNSISSNSSTMVDGTYANGSVTGPTTQTVSVENRHHGMGNGYSFFLKDAVPPPPTCSVAAGGPPFTAAGAVTYQYLAVYPNNGWGAMTAASNSCNANGTTQQTTVTIPAAVPGAIGYNYYRGGLIMNGGGGGTTTPNLSIIDQGTLGGQTVNQAGGGPAGMQGNTVWGVAGQYATLKSLTNCSSSASPAVCGSAMAGSVAVPTGATPTLVVNTTAVTANSQIFLNIDEGLGTKLSVTCNTTLATLVQPVVTARTAATSFTIQVNATLAVNPACVSYMIVN
jgi:hypothetical protein